MSKEDEIRANELLNRELFPSLENREDFIETMREGFDDQEEPYVGTFFYSPKEQKLVFVQKTSSADIRPNQHGQKTTRALHVTIYQHEKNRARSKGLPWNYPEDYTKLPRGRVWSVKGVSVVTVGTWISVYPEVEQLVREEFELPDDAEFRIDSHWDIGSGWSGDRL